MGHSLGGGDMSASSAGDNRLPELRDLVQGVHADALRHATIAAERAVTAGGLLAEAKALCAHGAWGPFLAETGIPERSAQRYLALHRLAFTPAIVADLGGVAAAAAWGSDARLPRVGAALAGRVGGWASPDATPLALVWAEGDGHHVGVLDLGEASPHAVTTRRPLLEERGVWATLWHMLDHRLPGLAFQPFPEPPVALLAEFEAARAEA